jgi:hypothetical protein
METLSFMVQDSQPLCNCRLALPPDEFSTSLLLSVLTIVPYLSCNRSPALSGYFHIGRGGEPTPS